MSSDKNVLWGENYKNIGKREVTNPGEDIKKVPVQGKYEKVQVPSPEKKY